MAIVNGNIKQIDLGIASFEALRKNDALYIDKSLFIEHFLNEASQVQLVARQRRLGKSLNLDMLACFLSDKKESKPLFQNLAIEQSPLFEKINSAPVFYFDFKNLTVQNFQIEITEQLMTYLEPYLSNPSLGEALKSRAQRLIENPKQSSNGLLLLTEIVYKITGKKSYLLIDEYDKLLVDNYNTDHYEDILSYETALFSAGLKGNHYLEKALLTGVMRVSHESMLSGLNNLQTYDLFEDTCYTQDFGLIETEIDALQPLFSFDKKTVKDWYNGIKINGHAIYNIYSVLSYCHKHRFLNYWGRSGRIQMIIEALTPTRYERLTQLLNGETITIPVDTRISPKSLQGVTKRVPDSAFYSLLTQTGYLSVEKTNDDMTNADVKIPNIELMKVWKTFILDFFIEDSDQFTDLFSNVDNLDTLNQKLTSFLSDRLSFYDITKSNERTKEELYHIFTLGLFSVYHNVNGQQVHSNREAGSGRYDILLDLVKCSVIFEFKSVEKAEELPTALDEAIAQIDTKRYFTAVTADKPLIKIGVAFCGKQCVVKSVRHVW